jgi:hypothetical protein
MIMKKITQIKFTLITLLLVVIILFPARVYAQFTNQDNLPYIPLLKRNLTSSEIFIPPPINKKPGHLSKSDWQELIDATWGPGLPTPEKLAIFDAAFNDIDHWYGAFMNLDVDIDSLRDLYRPEIENGVSRGRFAAIMNYFSMALKDAHTMIADRPVNWGTYPNQGIPLFVVGTWTNNFHFGANLTPLPDSTLLVYKALPNHRLGLEAGDIVLGYDGIPWKVLYKELLDAQLPIAPTWVWGSTDESMTHIFLQSAGMNWHLFDTIDIIKYNTGDTLHLQTSILASQSGDIWGNEQLPIRGVAMPNVFADDFVSWGIVEGTQIGYIYVTSWDPDPQYQISIQFYNAIDSLMHHHETTGLIVDFRLNYGGYMLAAHAGYSLLFNTQVRKVAFDVRGDPNRHLYMIPHPFFTADLFTIPGYPSTYYDNPIAVLAGPGSVSNGDWETLRMKFHPMVRTFGKKTNGAFTSSDYPSLGHPDWFYTKATGSGYLLDGHVYLAHTGVEMDEYVWLTQQSVVNGIDDVVYAAIEWINNPSSVEDEKDHSLSDYYLSNNYPNPFNPSTKIKFTIPLQQNPLLGGDYRGGLVTLKVYNVLGSEIATIVNEVKPAEKYEVKFDATGLTSGIYFYQLRAGNFIETKKMLLLK